MNVIETHTRIAIDEIKDQLGDKWDTLQDSHRLAAIRSAKRMVELEWKQRHGKDIKEDLAFVKVTVDGFKLVGEIALYDAFWKGVDKAFKALSSFLIRAGIELFKGINIWSFINE